MPVAVGKIGTLSCFEIQTVLADSLIGVLQHFFDADIKRLVGRVAARDALKPQRRAVWFFCLDLGLDVDVRQHAMRHRVVDFERDEQIL